MTTAWHIFRLAAVLLLVTAAAVALSRSSRLPPALRGIAKTLGAADGKCDALSRRRRAFAFLLLLAAFVLACI